MRKQRGPGGGRLGLRLAACFAVAVCLLAGMFPAAALQTDAPETPETEGRTVRVAYPMQEGLTGFDEYGNRSGYTYEYLEEIAQYTGWNYEFVDRTGDLNDSLTELMDMLDTGSIDLMGAIVYSEELGKQYDYSSHSYGTGETVLQVPYSCPQDLVVNSKVQQDIRVAVASTTGARIQELEAYCSMNLLTPDYVLCGSLEEQIKAVEEGRADVFLNSSINYAEGVRTVARFAPRPFYFITTKGQNSELMEELNSAMQSIEQADPHFATTLFEKYFVSPNTELNLTGAESAYASQAGTLKVGVLENQPPYQYLDPDTGGFRGIAVDLLGYVSEKTGLSFELVGASDQETLYRMAQEGQINMVAGMPYDYDLARQQGISMSQPYVSTGYILLMRENISESSLKGKRLALTNTGTYKGETVGKVVQFPTIDACVRAVADGEADYTYVDVYTAQYYINQPYYRGLKLVAQTYDPRKVCFGVVKSEERVLLSILNKTVTVISEMDRQGIINQNLLRKTQLSLGDFVWQNPVESVIAVAAVFAVIVLVLFVFLWQRVRMNRKNALELKKHYQVYALVNEYFFEYDFRTQLLLVFLPSKDSQGQPETLRFDRETLASPEHVEFLKLITSRQDGMRELYMDCITGKSHWLRIALETVYDGNDPAYALGKIHIIDEERQEKDALREMAQLDSLTRLYNAEATRTLVCDGFARLAPGEQDGFILVDVDRFKSINDTYGHLRGDETLKQVAELLKVSVRSGDVVGRPGGDEFAVYLHRIPSREMLAQKCGALCEKARSCVGEDGLRFTFSVGAAAVSPGEDYDDAYRRADAALYEAKRGGRDRYSIAPETK